jgi:CDP-diacylglycerol---serine O-phosphatidyltransferase
MTFFLILSPTQGYPIFRNIGFLFGFIYLLGAAVRLARFNVITHPLLQRGEKAASKDFLGLPVPAAAATVSALMLTLLELAEHERELHRWALALPPLLLLIAVLMVSTVRYPSFKALDWRTRARLQHFVIAFAVIGAVIMLRPYSLLALMLGYIGFGLVRHGQRARRLRRSMRGGEDANSPPTTV